MPLDNLRGSALETRLRRETRGEVLFDAFSRGRYSTDVSIYQIEPLGVVVPKSREDAAAAIAIAREEGVPVLPRGGARRNAGRPRRGRSSSIAANISTGRCASRKQFCLNSTAFLHHSVWVSALDYDVEPLVVMANISVC